MRRSSSSRLSFGRSASLVIFILLLFFQRLVINREIGLVGQATFLVRGPLLKVGIDVRFRKELLGLTGAEPGDALQGGQIYKALADLDLLFLDQPLVHALNPTVALAVQPLQQFGVNVNLVLPLLPRDLSLLPDDRPHGIAAEVQAAADLPQRHPRLMQLEHGLTHVQIDHQTPPAC